MYDPVGHFLSGQELQNLFLIFVLNTRKKITRTARLGSPTDVITTAIQVKIQRMLEEQKVNSSQVGNALPWMLYSLVE